jgi:hypothetical protein
MDDYVTISEKLGTIDAMVKSAKTWMEIHGRYGTITRIMSANDSFLSEQQKSALLALALVKLAEESNDR